MTRPLWVLAVTVFLLGQCDSATAQSPRVLYTWDGSGNIQDWKQNFGNNLGVLDNLIVGELTITETGPVTEEISISDGANRRLEVSSELGGLDLTGLDAIEFDLGHNGSGNVDVQFYVQASTGFDFVTLAPDVPVGPGVTTYSLPLSQLSAAQQVYIRTIGFTARAHAAEGPLVWTVQEVRSVGSPLTTRDLATHDVGSSDNGLQGAIANFDLGAIAGNDGGQNQTGLAHNPNGPGSLQWTDRGDHGVGDPSGAAIAYGNGTVWNGNSFNERLTDLSNYEFVQYRMRATNSTGPPPAGGTLGVQAYYQTGSFNFQQAGTLADLPIDGEFHTLTFPLAGLADMFDVQFSGVNLSPHATDLVIDIDLVQYVVPEPGASTLVGMLVTLLVASRGRLGVRC